MVHERGLRRKPFSTAFAGNLHGGAQIGDFRLSRHPEEPYIRGEVGAMPAAHRGCGDKSEIDCTRVIHDVKKKRGIQELTSVKEGRCSQF